jgi:putative hemolysin
MEISFIGLLGLLAILVLVAANGFFVAAEFSLVAVRRSRVEELVDRGLPNAASLEVAVDRLDANLAATQLGITISSLALGWIGEPVLAQMIEPGLERLFGDAATFGSHAIAVVIAFAVITTLHIVLGELAPKSLALQRSERTALLIVRPLSVFLFLFRPAIFLLNGLGNLILRLFGLTPGAAEGSLHSPDELKLLIQESGEAGVIGTMQQEIVVRALNIGGRRISDIMTPRTELDWIDADDERAEMLKAIRISKHEQLLVGRGGVDEPLGIVFKRDLLHQALEGEPVDPMAVLRDLFLVHETTSIFRVLEFFKSSPIRVAGIVDEYGILAGIVTQTDILEAIAGELADASGREASILRASDGSRVIDGLTPAHEVFEALGLKPVAGDFHTIAGFIFASLAHLPQEGERFTHGGWVFEVAKLDGRRVDKIIANKQKGALRA